SSEVRALAGRDLPFGPERTIRIEWPGGSCAVYEVYWAGEVAAAETARGMFRREGESWSIAWRGRRCLVRDVRGPHYIAHPLRHRGREFHALALVAGNGSGPAGAQRGYGGPALDAQARTVYRRRLDDLRDDLEEAEALCDLGRAARARGEQEALTDELAAAVGLDGRDRSAAAAAERARSTVAQRTRVAPKRVGNGLPPHAARAPL